MTLQIVMILGFVLIHILAEKLRFLDVVPRSRWLSAAGGISVSYVFLHVLPELTEVQHHLQEGYPSLQFLQHHAYLVALFGLCMFYGLEATIRKRHSRREPTTDGLGLFWVHISAFSVYNLLIGYLLVELEHANLSEALTYFVAMALHFIVNDFGLRMDHQHIYNQVGRWVLCAAVILGWILGNLISISESSLGVLFALLAGGVILNVLKEELPEERQSRFIPFFLGAAAYSFVLLVV